MASNLHAVSKLVDKWIDLFRAGDYTDKGKGKFTEQDIQGIVDRYDPTHHEAPGVIGHTQEETPAYCWFSKLRRVGGLLQGQIRQVVPAFEEALEQGRYKKRSVELYPGTDGFSLRRVAFLGSSPPEVKGLADIQFEQEDKDAIEIEFSEETEMSDLKEADKQGIIDGVIAKFRELFPASKVSAAGEAAATFTEADVKRISGEAIAAALAPLEAKFSERASKLATAETGSRAAAAIAGIKAKGAWVPAFDVMGLPAVFDELAKVTETITFGEGDKKVTQTPLEILTAFMEAHSKIVPTGRKVEAAAAAAPDLANLPKNSDPNSVAFNEAIQARMKEKKISFGEAMDQIAEEQPHLTISGGATTGKV